MSDSLQRKGIGKERTSIVMDIDGDGSPKRELPFVVGVLGDFAGNAPTQPPKRMKDRRFIDIDRDNFNEVMQRIGPGLKLKVKDTLTEGEEERERVVELSFKEMEDFSPARIAQQVEPLKKLLEARARLRELQARIDRSDELQEGLDAVLKQTQDVMSGKQGDQS